MKNKVLATVLGSAVLLVSLTACGKTAEATTVMDKAQVEAAYLGDVYTQNNDTLRVMSDSQLLTLGYYACEQLKTASLKEFAQRIAQNTGSDTAQRDALYVVTASAVLHLCPEYKGQAGL